MFVRHAGRPMPGLPGGHVTIGVTDREQSDPIAGPRWWPWGAEEIRPRRTPSLIDVLMTWVKSRESGLRPESKNLLLRHLDGPSGGTADRDTTQATIGRALLAGMSSTNHDLSWNDCYLGTSMLACEGSSPNPVCFGSSSARNHASTSVFARGSECRRGHDVGS